jgi:hypothetical protein
MGKNIPLRKCLGCDEMLGKKGLVRVVRTKDGGVSIDPTGKMSGRGAYICNDKNCFEKAVKKKSLERALKCAIPPELYESLKERISDE